jgi:hypothetical protein
LADGIFSYQKSKFGNVLKGLEIENFAIFYLCPFGIHYGYLVMLWSFGIHISPPF